MEIVVRERRVKLSVREFAEFKIGPSAKSLFPSGHWRARVGQEWHESLRRKLAAQDSTARFETVVKGTLEKDGWLFELEGRIDQMVEERDRIRVIEVKTTMQPLPADDQELRERYPHYFLQLASYLTLLQATHPIEHKKFDGELLFVDVAGGFPQTVPLESDPKTIFEEQAKLMLPFLKERLNGQERLRSLTFHQPFERLRPGQRESMQGLASLANGYPTLLFEAPTGFGKTGILLEFALSRMKEGVFDRLLYLTGKATSQNEVVRHLRMMVPGGELRYLQIRNQIEHSLHASGRDQRLSRDELHHRWSKAEIRPQNLFQEGCVTLKEARALGAKTGVPPYEITRACLPFADLWLGDYNYLFQPNAAQLIANLHGFAPKRTILIIDEAHNLADRVISGLSPRFDDGATARLRIELRETGRHKSLDDLLGEWGKFLSARRSSEVLDLTATYEAQDLLESFSETLSYNPPPFAELSEVNLELLWKLSQASRLMDNGSNQLLWSPQDGVLEIACLDASQHIAEQMNPFGLSILTSATLEPMDEFASDCGLTPDSYAKLKGRAPWRRGAYRVAVDARVDTRYTQRAKSYPITTDTILTAAKHTVGPVVVYFPSYRYAKEIEDRLRSHDDDLPVAMQPRLTKLDERIAFLENALENAKVLLLVLGGSFSEGIDLLGGRIETAILISPALPEVNALREARLDNAIEPSRKNAFRTIYQIPGMRKINQAIGRLVRNPGQKATVLLQGRRFQLPEYRELLDVEYQDGPVLHDQETVRAWLAEPFSISS